MGVNLFRYFYKEEVFIAIKFYCGIDIEVLLLLFLLYSLLSIFNDVNKDILHYIKLKLVLQFVNILLFLKISVGFLIWNFCSSFIFVKVFYKIKIIQYMLVECLYTLVSKFIILNLCLIVLFISKKKLISFITFACIFEFPIIFGFSLLFLFLLTSSYDFFCIYLALEGLGLTLYVFSSMLYYGIVSIEASIKYFSLGAISTGVFLLGVSILFGCVGSLNFLEIQIFLGSCLFLDSILELKLALLCIIFGFLFKISAFPCHIWVADVYEGIWTPITLFFAVVIKVTLLLLFIRIIFNVLFSIIYYFQNLFIVISVGSMLVGALGAFKQVRIKRFIAYTSINQVGFIFLGIASCNLTGLVASLVYLILYSVMSLSFFLILINTKHIITGKNMLYLCDLYCFSIYNIECSEHLVLILLSMGGLPPLGGFIGKLFLYFSAMEARLDLTILFSLLLSIVSIYYYLSFIRYVWFEKHIVLKLYVYNKCLSLDLLLRTFSLFLVLFILILPFIIYIFIYMAISCVFPLVFF